MSSPVFNSYREFTSLPALNQSRFFDPLCNPVGTLLVKKMWGDQIIEHVQSIVEKNLQRQNLSMEEMEALGLCYLAGRNIDPFNPEQNFQVVKGYSLPPLR